MKGLTGKQKLGWTVITIVVLLWALGPLLSILMTSFKASGDLNTGNFLPTNVVLDNYREIFAGSAQELFLPALRNSIGITLIATAIAVVLATLCAYAIARLDFPGKRLVLVSALGVSMFPVSSIVTPLFYMWRTIGLYVSWPAVSLPHLLLTLPSSIYTLAAYFHQISCGLERAAQD